MDTAPKPFAFRESDFVDKNVGNFHDLKPSPPINPQEDDLQNNKSRSKRNAIENFNEDITGTDFGAKDALNIVKSLDANRYATKKTIAQGMLDIALLTANASQLKYILQVGKQHEFYTLMLTLICTSIGLQLLQGVICIMLGSSYNINKTAHQPSANVWNNVSLAMMLLTVAVNVIISAFEMRTPDVNDPSSNNDTFKEFAIP